MCAAYLVGDILFLDLLYICILFNGIFGWRCFFICTAKFVVVISFIVDTFKQTEGKKDNAPSEPLFLELRAPSMPNKPFSQLQLHPELAPTGVLEQSCSRQSWSHAKQALSATKTARKLRGGNRIVRVCVGWGGTDTAISAAGPLVSERPEGRTRDLKGQNG